MYRESENDVVSTTRTISNLRKTLDTRLDSEFGNGCGERCGTELMKMHGLDHSNFEFLTTVDSIIGMGKRTNDVSIDDNSNKSGKHIGSAVQESIAPVRKAIGFDYFYRKVREIYGKDEAKRLFGKVLDYTLGLSDETNLNSQYCWSFNASLFVVGGKDFGGYRALPPENVGEYVGGLCEIVHEFSANLAGALAIGTFFFDIAHIMLYKENVDLRELRSSPWLRKSVISEYSQFIRSVNNLSRNGIESPFTNVSIFDRPKIKKLLDEFDWYFPFDKLPISKPESIESEEKLKAYYQDFLTEYVMELQDIYLDLFDKGDRARGGAPFKFPVTTINLAKTETAIPKIVDKDFLKDVCNRDIFRYNLFISKGSKVASCCFRGDQPIFGWSDGKNATEGKEDGKEIKSGDYRIEDLYAQLHRGDGDDIEFTVPAQGKSVKAKVIKIDYDKPFVAIGLSDGSKLITTDNHKNAVKISDNHYADFESWEIEVGMKFYCDPTSINSDGLEVISVNRNIPNSEKIAYCLQIIDRDATHFDLPNGVVTHNCRLINDMEMMDVAAQSNSFGAGGSISLGSHRVITNNTVRIALQANTKDEFYAAIYENMEDSAKLLYAHKELLRDLEASGCQPFISAGWIDLDRSFSTFGLLGIYETAEIFRAKFGNGEDTEGNMLRFVNTTMEQVSKKYSIIGNIGAIPGESFAVRLCKADQLLFPNNEYIGDMKLYSNQLFPLTVPGYSVWDRLEHDGRYNRLITGGGIIHITVLEKTTPKQSEKFIVFACEHDAEHMALNPFFSICENGHSNFGKLEHCPECGSGITDFMTRTIGYFALVSNMNYVRKNHEVPNRVGYGKKDF